MINYISFKQYKYKYPEVYKLYMSLRLLPYHRLNLQCFTEIQVHWTNSILSFKLLGHQINIDLYPSQKTMLTNRFDLFRPNVSLLLLIEILEDNCASSLMGTTEASNDRQDCSEVSFDYFLFRLYLELVRYYNYQIYNKYSYSLEWITIDSNSFKRSNLKQITFSL